MELLKSCFFKFDFAWHVLYKTLVFFLKKNKMIFNAYLMSTYVGLQEKHYNECF